VSTVELPLARVEFVERIRPGKSILLLGA